MDVLFFVLGPHDLPERNHAGTQPTMALRLQQFIFAKVNMGRIGTPNHDDTAKFMKFILCSSLGVNYIKSSIDYPFFLLFLNYCSYFVFESKLGAVLIIPLSSTRVLFTFLTSIQEGVLKNSVRYC